MRCLFVVSEWRQQGFVCCSVAPFRCGGGVVVSLWPFLGWCVTENVCALTACPAGDHILYRQKVTKERLKGFALEKPTRGFPLDLPVDGANAPYPLIPAGLFVFPAGGSPPPAYGLRGRRRAAGGVGWDRLAGLWLCFVVGRTAGPVFFGTTPTVNRSSKGLRSSPPRPTAVGGS